MIKPLSNSCNLTLVNLRGMSSSYNLSPHLTLSQHSPFYDLEKQSSIMHTNMPQKSASVP